VQLAGTDIAEECITSIIKFNRIIKKQLLVTADVVPSSLILSILMIGVIRYTETSVPTTSRQHHTQENGILHSYRRGNLKPYNLL
jgi:hypothetical protein